MDLGHGSQASVEAVDVLIIGGDPAVAHVLQACLSFGGFTSELCDAARPATECLNSSMFSAILLDVSSLGADGIQLIKTIGSRHDVPLIALSNAVSEADVVAALDAGAQDFVLKPFRPRELLARLRAALRRFPGRPPSIPAVIAHANRPNVHCSRQLYLSRKELELLALLENCSGGVATVEDIVQNVWGDAQGRPTSALLLLT